ncbi:MAG TPA: hypothetical protein VK144_07435 [Bacillota bacterium]|nr:hypothetical protein [Bacillota bacterium]
MQGMSQEQMRDILLQSLYDFHYANNGASYHLPKEMLEADVNSKQAIEYLLNNELATDAGEGTNNLVLSITPKGMNYISQLREER